MNKTNISYLDYTWNPTHGCSPATTGCLNCWAKKMAGRLAAMGVKEYDPKAPFKPTCHPDRLEDPVSVKRPQKIGVSFMGDLFHADIPTGYIKSIAGTFMDCPQHIFVLLTKRPKRMRKIAVDMQGFGPNVWLGVSAENQEQANKRIPVLLDTPAVIRFVSVEPCLSPVDLMLDLRNDLGRWDSTGKKLPLKKIDWVICGCESGSEARPMDTEWAWHLKNQCVENNVPFFLKQMKVGGKLVQMPQLSGKTWAQMPRTET